MTHFHHWKYWEAEPWKLWVCEQAPNSEKSMQDSKWKLDFRDQMLATFQAKINNAKNFILYRNLEIPEMACKGAQNKLSLQFGHK